MAGLAVRIHLFYPEHLVATMAETRSNDYVVKDIALADFGRKEIEIAETEMPGLMALREEFGASQPLKGARITGSLHMTIQTAVLIETLTALGAEVRWASCNIFSTQDHAAAAIAASGVPVFAIKGETLEEYWDYVARIFDWGQDADLQHDPRRRRRRHHVRAVGRAGRSRRRLCSTPTNEEEEIFAATLKRFLKERPGYLTKTVADDQGRVGRDHHRRPPPLRARQAGQAPVPGDQRQRQRDQVEVRQSLRLQGKPGRRDPPRHRRDARRQGRDCVAGFGDVGKGSAASLRNGGARVLVTEVDPICALQAAMEGYEVVTMEEAVDPRRHLRHRDRQHGRHHRSTTCGR